MNANGMATNLGTIEDLNNESSIVNKNLSTQNATNSHPLMYSPTSPVSTDYPDLIPEKPKNRNYYSCENSSSDFVGDSSNTSVNNGENFDQSHFSEIEYDANVLPDFPPSPSAVRRSILGSEMRREELSDNENDNSVYEAHLSSNLQNVSLTMNEKEGNLNFLAHSQRSHKLRRLKIVHTNVSSDSDVSSVDSISESLKPDEIFGHEPNKPIQKDLSLESELSSEPIEPLSADEEQKHLRHWQCMVLPDGEQRTIDMRVIEPYKRVLSHGGYLRSGGNTAIVVFSACFLPDRSRVDYDYVMDNLFLYVLWTLEQLVTDDYVLVYLHGAATRLPSFSWLKRCYHMVGRRLRKNLVHLYLVHPTLWIKTMLFMAKPFISSKFYRKITYVAHLKELYGRIPLESNAIPDKVKAYDNFHYGS